MNPDDEEEFELTPLELEPVSAFPDFEQLELEDMTNQSKVTFVVGGKQLA